MKKKPSKRKIYYNAVELDKKARQAILSIFRGKK